MELSSDEMGINVALAFASVKKLFRALKVGTRVNRESQRLALNMELHKTLLNLLKILDPETDSYHDQLQSECHSILQVFCEGNPQNQFVLYEHLDFLMVIFQFPSHYLLPFLNIPY